MGQSERPHEGSDQGSKVKLNSAPVVNQVIREFVRDLLAVLERKRGSDVLPDVEFMCARMNNLFLGHSQGDVYSFGPWNAPDQIGFSVLLFYRIEGQTHNGVRDAFMLFASRVVDLYQSSGDKFGPDQTRALDALMRELCNALLGLPPQSEGRP